MDARAGGAVPRASRSAFGKLTVHRVDAWVAYRFAGGPEPEPRPREGAAARSYEWRLWGHVVVAWLVSCGVLGILHAHRDPSRTSARSWPAGRAGRRVVLVGWLVFGPVWAELSTRAKPEKVSAR